MTIIERDSTHHRLTHCPQGPAMTDHLRDEWFADAILAAEDEELWRRDRAAALDLAPAPRSRADYRASLAADMRAAHADDLTGEEWRAGSRERLAWIARLADARQREREAAA